MYSLKQQRGMTFASVSALVFVICVFALVAIKLIPIYMENLQVVSVLEGTHEKFKDGDGVSVREVRASIDKRFNIENIRDIDPDEIEIELTSDGLYLYFEYEIRTTLFANIEFLVTFVEEMGEFEE